MNQSALPFLCLLHGAVIEGRRCILGLALTGPSQTTEIDANRSAVFRNGFKKKKQKHNRICLNLIAHQNSRVLRASDLGP